jgi:hypothetical protein
VPPLLTSCFEDTTDLDLNGAGSNLAGFEKSSQNLAAIADGEVYVFPLSIKVFGPTANEVLNDVTLTIAADTEASTAIAGTHFRLDNPELILSPGNNLLGVFNVSMLTDGIITPLDKSPVLVLKVTAVSGDSKVTHSAKAITLKLNYACPSFLEGNYSVTTEYIHSDGSAETLNWTEYITETGLGEYRTERVGHWSIASLGGTPGFTFTDVCNVISVGGQNLVDTYSNWVEGTGAGSVDAATGELYIEYSICYGGACRYAKSTYTPQ